MVSLAPHDCPREKLERAGAAALGDNELVAVLIGQGAAGASALVIAYRVLVGAGGVHALVRMTSEELTDVDGIGRRQAARLQAALELGRRTLRSPPGLRPQLLHARAIAAVLAPDYGAYPVERFGVVLLDARHRLIRTRLVAVGALDASVIHPREVFRVAAVGGAAAIVAFPNHPSGDVTPSADDMVLTTRLARAGDLMGIPLLDHLILADTNYCSLREAGHRAWHD